MTQRVFKDDQRNEFFLREGYAVLPLLGPAEVKKLRDVFDRFGINAAGNLNFTVNSSDLTYRLSLHDALLEVLQGPIEGMLAGYQILGTNFVTKAPGAEHLALHQDDTILDEDKNISVNVWCITHDVDTTYGCLTVVPQSHRWTRQRRAFGDQLNRSPFRNVIPLLEQRFEKPVPLRAGEAIVYHSRTIHGSMANQRDALRIATIAGAVPVGVPSIFHHRHSADSIEAFASSKRFYWEENFVYVRPASTPSLGFVEIREDPPFTEAELLAVADAAARDPSSGLP